MALPSATRPPARHGNTAALVAFALAALLAGVVHARWELPPVSPAIEVPAASFSGARARAVLERLWDGSPRPVGSAANERFASRVEAELRRIGVEPERQAVLATSPDGTCAHVRNVVARIEGRGKAILLGAHLDTVSASPGASDDGTGVATLLEVARAVRAQPVERPVVLLFSDGEEPGLLGARAFIDGHRWRDDVGLAINADGRGSGGRVLMHQTSRGNAGLVALLAGCLSRPRASSAFQAVYDALPATDSDLTPWVERGVPALNFAFMGTPFHYHTPADDLPAVASATLQELGDDLLGVVRAASATPVWSAPSGDAVYFDLFAGTLVHWPSGASVIVCVATILLVMLAGGRHGPAHRRLAAVAFGASGTAAVLALSGVVGALQLALWNASAATSGPWVAQPACVLGAQACAALLVTGAAARASGFRALPGGSRSHAIRCFWALTGAGLSTVAPEASYLFLLPALAGAACALGIARSSIADLIVFAVAGVLWAPLVWPLYLAVGLAVPGLHAALVALIVSPLLPVLADLSPATARRALAIAACAAAGLTLAAAARPPFSTDCPQPSLLLLHRDADTGTSRWLASALFGPPAIGWPPGVAPARVAEPPFPFASALAACYVAPAPQTPAANAGAPALSEVREERTQSGPAGLRRRLTMRVHPRRDAALVALAIPPDAGLIEARVGGSPVPPPPAELTLALNGWKLIWYVSPPPDGYEVQLGLTAAGPVRAVLLDYTAGLPEPRPLRPATSCSLILPDGELVTRGVTL